MSIFTQTPFANVPDSYFDMSHDFKLSCNMGELIPVCLIDCIPGDKIDISTRVFSRMMPMLAPILHDVNITAHHFFVPNRLVWPNWEKFITAGVPDVDTPAFPYFSNKQYPLGSLHDYLGVPTQVEVTKVSAIPAAAMQKIFSDWFRDQNLQEDLEFKELIDGDNEVNFNYFSALRKRAWQHDYRTSSLPWAQKGEPVKLPIFADGDVPVMVRPDNVSTGLFLNADGSNFPVGDIGFKLNNPVGSPNSWATATSQTYDKNLVYDPNGSLFADTQLLESEITINNLRWAVRLQEYLEKNARGGTRYIELILAHFGVRSSDSRLQRSEYIGSVKQNMVISEVLQTSETLDSPQGNMAGHGISVSRNNRKSYYCEEHGYFMTVLSARPRTAYQQGLPRHFSRFDPTQFPWPSFAQLGEQEVLNQEVYYDATDGLNEGTFGYQSRYAECKYMESRVAGELKTTLNYWHMGRIFPSRPALNAQFIECNPTHRIFAVTDDTVDKLVLQVTNDVGMRRKLPKYGIPTI